MCARPHSSQINEVGNGFAKASIIKVYEIKLSILKNKVFWSNIHMNEAHIIAGAL